MSEQRRGLLKREEREEQWIMLQDLNSHHQTPNYPHHHLNPYQRLYDNHEFEKSKHYRKQQSGKIQELPKQEPFNPKVITINGQTFKEVEKDKPIEKKPKKSKLPTMHVSCYSCNTVQSVPGTALVFSCCSCSQQNHCTPIYKIIICCSCSSKVCFSVGASELIRCTRCGTVNQIPSLNREERTELNEECISVQQQFQLRDYLRRQK